MELKKEQVVDYLSNLPVIEMSQLVKELEDKWGVSAAAPVAAVATGSGTTNEAEQKTEFKVTLTGAGSNKIAVIKEVRSITSLGLKEAKALVDGAPKVVKDGVAKDEAQKLKEALEKAGATVEVK